MADDESTRTHTTPEEGHPAGTGDRSDRDIGGPRTQDGAAPEGGDEQAGEAHGTKESPFEPHE